MQVDGFRFDIMGHLMLSTMKKIQAALAELTLEQDGVDGKSLYIYGEAWDFGEVNPQSSLLVNMPWAKPDILAVLSVHVSALRSDSRTMK